MTHIYLLALGSNRRHVRYGGPRDVLRAAALDLAGLGEVLAVSGIIDSAPIGPSRRTYANGAVVVETALPPPAMLRELKALERDYGVRRGQAWSARVLDLDIILWSGGIFAAPGLSIPHRLFRQRDFVLRPAAEELGCTTYLESCLDMASRPSWADRQLAILRETGDPKEVVRQLTAAARVLPLPAAK